MSNVKKQDQKENVKRGIESLLFAAGKPLSYAALFRLLGEKESVITREVATLAHEYAQDNRGIALIVTRNTVEMVTSPISSKTVSKLKKFEFEEKLSSAALETLAIVVYRGPITRAEVELIRGLNSVYTLRNLSMRGLVKTKQNPLDGRASMYEVTTDFLKHCGITGVKELPEYQALSKKTTFEQYLEEKEEDSKSHIISSVNR
ncbi:SMC-Scp complex subunit ScpB [Patescibacteria group bacterium]|nr:SMC-Scp complex subunit ScpB [Patescibacteria group bacterium]